MFSSFGRMNSSQTDSDLINAVHAHMDTQTDGEKPELLVPLLTGNTRVMTVMTMVTAHENSTWVN